MYSLRWNNCLLIFNRIEEIKNTEETKKKKRFELEKQDQINMNKFLQDIKEYEAQQVRREKFNIYVYYYFFFFFLYYYYLL